MQKKLNSPAVHFIIRSSIDRGKHSLLTLFHCCLVTCRCITQMLCWRCQIWWCNHQVGRSQGSPTVDTEVRLGQKTNRMWSLNTETLRTLCLGRNVIWVDPPPRSRIPTVFFVLAFLRWPEQRCLALMRQPWRRIKQTTLTLLKSSKVIFCRTTSFKCEKKILKHRKS